MYVPNSSSRASLAPGAVTGKESSVTKKSNKETELEDQLQIRQSQRMDDFKMFEQKLVDKQGMIAQLQIELKNTLNKVRYAVINWAHGGCQE